MNILPPVNLLTYQVSQWFGENLEKTKKFYEMLGIDGHNGLDFACPVGTPIAAVFTGKVKIYNSVSGGNSILLYGNGFRAFYCHLESFICRNGEVVQAGETIATSGNTGAYTTGPHLHFGLYKTNKNDVVLKQKNGYNGAIDPAPYLAVKFEDGTLVKTVSEPKVYLIQNGVKWWIKDEKTFEKWFGYKVKKAEIKDISLITYNSYPYGEIRFVV